MYIRQIKSNIIRKCLKFRWMPFRYSMIPNVNIMTLLQFLSFTGAFANVARYTQGKIELNTNTVDLHS